MAKVIQAPLIKFTCNHCGAICAGEPEEFAQRNTMPPTWDIRCPYCNLVVVCSPSALIARFVGGLTALPYVTCTVISDEPSQIDSQIRSLPPRR